MTHQPFAVPFSPAFQQMPTLWAQHDLAQLINAPPAFHTTTPRNSPHIADLHLWPLMHPAHHPTEPTVTDVHRHIEKLREEQAFQRVVEAINNATNSCTAPIIFNIHNNSTIRRLVARYCGQDIPLERRKRQATPQNTPPAGAQQPAYTHGPGIVYPPYYMPMQLQPQTHSVPQQQPQFMYAPYHYQAPPATPAPTPTRDRQVQWQLSSPPVGHCVPRIGSPLGTAESLLLTSAR